MQYSIDDSRELDTTLTAEKFDELKDLVLSDISLDRQKLVWKFPFTGSIAMKLDIVPVRDVRVRTACTDGSRIYVDMSFYAKLDERDRIFVLAHEIWHVVMMHMLRLQSRDADVFNIATDKEINYILSEEGLPCPSFCLYPDDDEKGLSAEEIYERIIKKNKRIGGKGNRNDDSGYDNDKSDNGGYHSSVGELSGQFDGHVYDDSDGSGTKDNGNGDSQNSVRDQWGEVGLDSDFNPSVDGDIADRIRENIVEAVQSVRRSERGTIPASIASYLESICKPEIDWKEMLSQFVTSCYGGSRQWLPANRRHIHSGLYLQSRRDERIKVTVAIDTSGSCTSDAPKFMGELISLLRSFGDYEVNVIQCDAEVSNFERYDATRPFDFNIDGYEMHGGGGTSFTPVFEYIADNSIETDCLIYFTDGFGDVMDQPPPYPTMWMLTKDGSEDFCSWGTKVRFKKDS